MQVTAFSLQLLHNELVLSAAGFFNLDFTLIFNVSIIIKKNIFFNKFKKYMDQENKTYIKKFPKPHKIDMDRLNGDNFSGIMFVFAYKKLTNFTHNFQRRTSWQKERVKLADFCARNTKVIPRISDTKKFCHSNFHINLMGFWRQFFNDAVPPEVIIMSWIWWTDIHKRMTNNKSKSVILNY